MEIYLYDTIGKDFFGEGVTADYVRKELDKAKKNEQVVVRINSPGGDVWEGEAIYNMLTRRGNIKVTIDALAASAASFIAMAGDEIEIAENATVMIHEAWTMGFGNKREITKTVDRLKAIDDQIAAKYSARSGKRDSSMFLADMESETWYNAQQAVHAGLADKIGQKLKVKAAVREPMLTENCIAAYWLNMPANLLAEPEGEEPTPAMMAAVQALDIRCRIEAKHPNAVVVAPRRSALETKIAALRK